MTDASRNLTLLAGIEKIQNVLGVSEGKACSILQQALQAGEFAAWRKRAAATEEFSPEEWQGAWFRLDRLRSTGGGGLIIKGIDTHPANFFISTKDFTFWLASMQPRDSVSAPGDSKLIEWWSKRTTAHAKPPYPSKTDDWNAAKREIPEYTQKKVWERRPAAWNKNPGRPRKPPAASKQ